ncbi:DUF4767 domain-containing protein, partial [Enterococcus faecium]|uniref:DUF4767 domain-containing protein n=1 Tax=Enterococcus faecium TaxID=1352 RepID=UPI001F5F447B
SSFLLLSFSIILPYLIVDLKLCNRTVYSDAETEPYLKKHVYLFGFQQNQPKVLVTQQNQGNPDNYLYFNETANNELKNGFNQIVYG